MSKVNWLPKDHSVVSTCLSAKNAAGLRDFIVKVFDAKAHECHTDDQGILRHGEVNIGESTIMLGEAQGQWGPMPSSFYVYVPDCDASFQRALAAGATSIMEPANQFYGDRHGTVRDAWGNMWTFGTHVEDVSPEEMQRRAKENMAKHGDKC